MIRGMSRSDGLSVQRMPDWLRRPIAAPGRQAEVRRTLDGLRLNTVCRSAKCPNQGECFSEGTATFLIMGGTCTRSCRFCAVEGGTPEPLDAEEPGRVAEAAARLGLEHVVVTAVTRDDVADGGAAHFVAVVQSVRAAVPEVTVEVLTSDFGGDLAAVDLVASARPDVFNHNLETVPRLYAEVRPEADYERSLRVLGRVGEVRPQIPTKSGLMLGLGETAKEVLSAMRDLRAAGCGMLTLGQYLRPSKRHLPVAEFVPPERFEALAEKARALGFSAVASAPFVRSSYHAARMVGG